MNWEVSYNCTRTSYSPKCVKINFNENYIVKSMLCNQNLGKYVCMLRLNFLTCRHTARDMKLIKVEIRKKKEDNTMLSRVNSELNQELQEVMEQRIALEIQLEHLRPFSY